MRLVLLFNAGSGPRFHNGDSSKRELAVTRKGQEGTEGLECDVSPMTKGAVQLDIENAL